MVHLGVSLVASRPRLAHNKTNADMFSILVPQLAATRPVVNIAAGAFGAAYDKVILRRNRNDQLCTEVYLNAIKHLRHELQKSEKEILPLMVAALLLAAAEAIQNKLKLSMHHLHAAFSMVKASSKERLGMSMQDDLQSVSHILHCVDYHISMFTWGVEPHFARLPVTQAILYPTTLQDLTNGHAIMQQWCLHFVSQALNDAWKESSDFPPAMVAQQDHMIAWLKRWLQTYTQLFEKAHPTPTTDSLQHLTLKAQTLTLLIAVSNIKPPTQVTYDHYAPEFEEIIRCADTVLRLRSVTGLPRYSPFQGVIHPLNFTVRKYRDPVSRRRAIQLLRLAGIEGPFHGEFESRVAARLVELEEGRAPFKALLGPDEMLSLADIPDSRRVYLCWVATPPDEHDEIGEDGIIRRRMCFSRRLRPVNAADRSQALWEVWEEEIEGRWPSETEVVL